MNVEIVKRSDYAKGFVVLPRTGWSNVLSHGSVAVADWQGISKRQSPAQLPGRSSLTSASSQDGSQELEINHNHYESDTKTSESRGHGQRSQKDLYGDDRRIERIYSLAVSGLPRTCVSVHC